LCNNFATAPLSETPSKAWETRRNGRRYFYTARRVNGRVVKEYMGRDNAGSGGRDWFLSFDSLDTTPGRTTSGALKEFLDSIS
jgi:hypothetical protein